MTAKKTPAYEGRLLPRPDDDVDDQGLAFDIDTLLGRRQMLRIFGLGAVSMGLAACGANGAASAGPATASSGSAGAEIADETAGPFPGDGSNGPDALEHSGIVRSDIRPSFDTGSATAEGVPMDLELTILDLVSDGAPFAGVAVYVWHCDRDGAYSMYGTGLEDENYLRGVQIADSDGVVRFTSIMPACYSGRWPHIHFEVYPDEASISDAANAIATSQVAIPADVCAVVFAEPGYEQSVTNLAGVTLESDNVFGDDGGAGQLATVTGEVASGFTVSLGVGVDTTTEPTGGGPGGVPPGDAPGA